MFFQQYRLEISKQLPQAIALPVLQGAFVPFAASAALFAGYLVVKFFPDLDVAKVLNGYFWFIGSIAVAGALRQPLRRAVSPCSCFLPSGMWQPTMMLPLA